MRLAASRRVARGKRITRPRSFLLRARFRCLAELPRLQDWFRSSSRVREQILPSCLTSRRYDWGHDETARASEPPLRVRAQRRWRSNRVPSRYASRIPDRCTVSQRSEYRCRAKIEPTQHAGLPQFPWLVPESVVSPVLNAEKIHTARDRGGKQPNRRW